MDWHWILRCGGAASPGWREPPVRTNGATLFPYLACARSRLYTFTTADLLIGPMSRNHSPSRNCEQKIVEDFLRLLCISSNKFLASASVSFSNSHSSMINKTGLVYFLRAAVNPVYITVKMYPCSGGTDTGSPELWYCESRTGIPRLIECYLRVYSLNAGSNPYTPAWICNS